MAQRDHPLHARYGHDLREIWVFHSSPELRSRPHWYKLRRDGFEVFWASVISSLARNPAFFLWARYLLSSIWQKYHKSILEESFLRVSVRSKSPHHLEKSFWLLLQIRFSTRRISHWDYWASQAYRRLTHLCSTLERECVSTFSWFLSRVRFSLDTLY